MRLEDRIEERRMRYKALEGVMDLFGVIAMRAADYRAGSAAGKYGRMAGGRSVAVVLGAAAKRVRRVNR